MHPELNPFAPGSGLTPPQLVGREAEVDAFDLTIARSRRRLTSRGIVLHGLRGVGKTVLLNRFRDQAERAEWFTVEIEGRTTDSGRQAARQKLGRAMLLAAHRFHRRSRNEHVTTALRSIKSFSLSLGVASIELGVEPAKGRADSGEIEIDLEEVLEDLAPALISADSAFGLFIDEMQDIDRELLAALLAVQHRAGQKNWPFYIVGAGLPALPSTLSIARSYAERLFDYREIGALSPSAAADALTIPARRHGMEFSDAALDALLTASGGYPYFLQTFGKAAWDAAVDRLITSADADVAIIEGTAALDMGFYPARWDRATPAERNYLRAMASDGDQGSRTAAVADRLMLPATSLSPARQSLIDKGVIYMPERGRVAFTVPGMSGFIHRQYAD
jgi:hypothetical protein